MAVLVVASRGARSAEGARWRHRADHRRVRRYGQATLQLAKLAGARVIATTRHAGKAATLRDLGADAVVGTADAERARAELLAITGDGVDHAVDYTGNPELLRLLVGVMRLGGTLVVTSEQGRDPLPFRPPT